jgi:hypothetical protein
MAYLSLAEQTLIADLRTPPDHVGSGGVPAPLRAQWADL